MTIKGIFDEIAAIEWQVGSGRQVKVLMPDGTRHDVELVATEPVENSNEVRCIIRVKAPKPE